VPVTCSFSIFCFSPLVSIFFILFSLLSSFFILCKYQSDSVFHYCCARMSPILFTIIRDHLSFFFLFFHHLCSLSFSLFIHPSIFLYLSLSIYLSLSLSLFFFFSVKLLFSLISSSSIFWWQYMVRITIMTMMMILLIRHYRVALRTFKPSIFDLWQIHRDFPKQFVRSTRQHRTKNARRTYGRL